MIVLKLGGSVITEKEKPMTADQQAIEQLAHEIALSRVKDLIVVHGGGSFGHPLAKQFRIAEGFKEKEQILGFSRTHRAMVELNGMIIDALIDHGVPAFPLPPSSLLVTDRGRITTLRLETVRMLLRLGLNPVLYGDAVLDTSMGFSILSGDQLSAKLALELNASSLLYGVDVDGVYDSDPKLNPKAKLLKSLSISRAESSADIGGSGTSDVTGGMMGKIREALPVVSHGIRVIVLNAKKPNNILKALKGERVTGTLLEK